MKPYLLCVCAVALLSSTACNSASSPDATAAPSASESSQNAAKAEAAANATSAAKVAAAPATRSAAPATEDGLDWALRINEEERTRPAILAFEMDGTDDQRISFECEEGSGRVFAGAPVGSRDTKSITVSSGDQNLTLAGRAESSDEIDITSFTSQEIAGNSPFLAALAQNGWVRLNENGHASGMMAASAAGKKAVKDFVAHCKGAGK